MEEKRQRGATRENNVHFVVTPRCSFIISYRLFLLKNRIPIPSFNISVRNDIEHYINRVIYLSSGHKKFHLDTTCKIKFMNE
jgi:hypothetical protein